MTDMIYLKTYFFDFFYSFSFLGHPGEHLPANTAFDHDNINLQVEDNLKKFLRLLLSQLFWSDNIKKYDFHKRDFLLFQLFSMIRNILIIYTSTSTCLLSLSSHFIHGKSHAINSFVVVLFVPVLTTKYECISVL